MERISVIIPTFQAGLYLDRLLEALQRQRLRAFEIIIIDSSSSDQTLSIARRHGCKTQRIALEDFRHGTARNLGADMAAGEILVYLTQDALPLDDLFLKQLTLPLREGKAAAATARQIAYPDADVLEKFARSFNYPAQSFVRTKEDLPRLGIKTYFFSNTASAVTKEAFCSVGRFSDHVIVNEDMDLCARLIGAGYIVAYQAEAQVYHSHKYSAVKLFKRYFDIGVYMYQAQGLLVGAKTDQEGMRFIRQAFHTLRKQKAWGWIAKLMLESGVKYVAFRLGYHHRWISPWLKRKISGQQSYWIGRD
jgi:rhamnosyltransferase